jgi:hypothetical protein
MANGFFTIAWGNAVDLLSTPHVGLPGMSESFDVKEQTRNNLTPIAGSTGRKRSFNLGHARPEHRVRWTFPHKSLPWNFPSGWTSQPGRR